MSVPSRAANRIGIAEPVNMSRDVVDPAGRPVVISGVEAHAVIQLRLARR